MTPTTSCSVFIPAGPRRRSRIATLLLASAVIVLAGCGGSDQPPGDPATYANIAALDSCSSLNEAYDESAHTAGLIEQQGGDASIPHSYMDAINERMEEVGC